MNTIVFTAKSGIWKHRLPSKLQTCGTSPASTERGGQCTTRLQFCSLIGLQYHLKNNVKSEQLNFPGTRIQPTLYLQKAKINNKQPKNSNTVEPRFNDLRYNDIPSITIHICLPSKRYSKMYGAEPQYNDLWYNDIPGLTMGMLVTKHKIFPVILIQYNKSNVYYINNNYKLFLTLC